MKYDDQEKIKAISEKHINVNLWLISLSFTIFTFISVIRPELLKDNVLLAIQLTLSIPLMMSSVFARQRIFDTVKKIKEWYDYGTITFVLAYGFLVNSVGIILCSILGFKIALIFFLANIISSIVYSYMEVREDSSNLKSRIYKDLFFLSIVVLLGILPCLM